MIGTTIYIDAGTFQEQVLIGKSLNIIGNDKTKTFVKAPVIMANVSNPNGTGQPIIYASGTGNTINISQLTVDGDGGRNVSAFMGVHYAEANGTFNNNRITGIHDSPVFTGNQRGIAFVANHHWDVSVDHTVTVSNNLIDDYQKGGIVIDELNTHGIVTGNIVIGANTAHVTAQNGIQFGYGAYGIITGNTVTNNIWNKVEHPHVDMASGILLVAVGSNLGVPTGNATVVGDNSLVIDNKLSGNEVGLLIGSDDAYGYGNNFNLTVNGNTFTNNKVHVWQGGPSALPNAFNFYDKRVDNLAQTDRVFGCIQYAIDEAYPLASPPNQLNASANTFIENVVVHTSVIINGAGKTSSTTVIPAFSGANPCSGASLCDGASNIFLVQASNVTIKNLTADGNNPSLTSGIFSNGVDVDARNGIITNHNLGVYNNLDINNVTVKNIYLRGIYASTGGTFTLHDNTVTNVAGESQSIAMMNWAGVGSFINNTVTYSNDGIVSNWSTGASYSGNHVSFCGSGIHTDNNSVTADQIFSNTITNCDYGIFVFSPHLGAQVYENEVTNCGVGLAAFRSDGTAPQVQFLRNTVNVPNSGTGAYFATNGLDWGEEDCSVLFENNFVIGGLNSFLLESHAGHNLNVVANYNSITGSASGVATALAGTQTLNLECNWWGATSAAAVAAAVVATDPPVDHTPWLINGTDADGTTPGFQPVSGSCSGTPVVVTLSSKTDVSCLGGSDGAIDISVAGGSGNYSYLWMPGNITTQDLSGLVTGISNIISQIPGETLPHFRLPFQQYRTSPRRISSCPANMTVNNDPGLCSAVVNFMPASTQSIPPSPNQQAYSNCRTLWQSFKASTSGVLTGIDVDVRTVYTGTIVIYSGEGLGGCQQYSGPFSPTTTGAYTISIDKAAGVFLTAGQTYTFAITGTCSGCNTCIDLWMTWYSGSSVYADGQYWDNTFSDCGSPYTTPTHAAALNCTFHIDNLPAGMTVSDNCVVKIATIPAPLQLERTVRTTSSSFTAYDCPGHSATCNFNVMVNDNQNPTITCPPEINVQCTSSVPALYNYAGFIAAGGTISDNCGINVSSFAQVVLT